jgi:hypothetical protein
VFSPKLQDEFLKRRDQLQPVDYAPKSQAHLPPEQRDQYLACEMQDTITGEVNGRKVTSKHRVVFVWGQAKARQEKAARDRPGRNRLARTQHEEVQQRDQQAAVDADGDLFRRPSHNRPATAQPLRRESATHFVEKATDGQLPHLPSVSVDTRQQAVCGSASACPRCKASPQNL